MKKDSIGWIIGIGIIVGIVAAIMVGINLVPEVVASLNGLERVIATVTPIPAEVIGFSFIPPVWAFILLGLAILALVLLWIVLGGN